MSIVETHQLTKRYGDFAALDQCSVSVEEGSVFGLLGPNGAGKTTLLRLLLGYLTPTSGSATICGHDATADSVRVRQSVAYLPGDARLPRHMRGQSVLSFFADLHPKGDLARSLSVAEQLELDLRRRVGFMSTGMRQKLALCVVLSTQAPIMILDEPTANLDPSVRRTILEHVEQAQAEGRTVIFSSHVLSEIERVCDRVVFLRRGRLALVQSMHELKDRHRIVATIDGAIPELPHSLREKVDLCTEEEGVLVIQTDDDLAPLLSWLATLAPKQLRLEPLGLGSIYDSVHHSTHENEVPSAGGASS